MDQPDLNAANMASLRTLTHIGASAPPTLRRRARERFGPRIVHTYGASEEGLVSRLGAADHELSDPASFACAGQLLPSVEVRFRRGDGMLAPAGEIGAIEVRSPSMAQGYRHRPDLQALVFQDGWYASGDLGRLDTHGRLQVFGRAVDIEFIEGRMITPTAIEDTLCRVPGVRYAVVVCDAGSRRRIAVIQPYPDAVVDMNICNFAVAVEHGDEVIRSMLMLVRPEPVPLTPQGKPDREAIRALGSSAIDSTLKVSI
jgi:fatty-acyl-CoA synthase